MGDHHHGHAALGQLLHDVEHLAHHLGVEGGGRLVKQHDIGVHAQGTGDGDTLFLTAGQLLGIGVGTVAQTHHVQQLAGGGLSLLLGNALGVHRCQGEILQHRHVGEQVEVLEHHAHLLAVQVDVGVFVGDIVILKEDLAVGGLFQKVQRAQHGGFARTGGAHNDHHFALLDLQRAVVQRMDAVGEDLGNAFHTDERVTGCRHGAFSFPQPRWPYLRGS